MEKAKTCYKRVLSRVPVSYRLIGLFLQRMFLQSIFFLLTTIMTIDFSYAASFDCSKAKTSYEKTICHDPELSDADTLLSESYLQLKQKLSKDMFEFIREEQKTWLAKIKYLCSDDERDCLLSIYKKRTADLKLKISALDGLKKEWDGVYLSPQEIEYASGLRERSADCFSLRRIDKTRLKFEWKTIGTNGHTCDVDGIAVANGDQYEWHGDTPKMNTVCSVFISLLQDRLEVASKGSCRPYYCGARAYLQNDAFYPSQIITGERCSQKYKLDE